MHPNAQRIQDILTSLGASGPVQELAASTRTAAEAAAALGTTVAQIAKSLLIDQDLLRYPELWAAAGTPNAVFRTSPEELARITGGEVADLRE